MEPPSRRLLETAWLPNPSLPEISFRETSFFRGACDGNPTRSLPTSEEVLARAEDIRGTVRFEELDLIVKFGHPSQVRTEEALTILAIRRAFPNNEVPVPEVYG